jgi:hypothetical protein
MNRTLALTILLLLASALSGCTAPGSDSVTGDATKPSAPATTEWQMSAQRSLGFYAGVQVLGGRLMLPQQGYCRSLNFTVPGGGTSLNFTLVSTPFDLSNGTYGPLGLSARSESWKQWTAYPDFYNPQQTDLDNPKRISFQKPEAGNWTVYVFTTGPAYHALGNLTIDLHGRSAAAPDSLGIQLWGPDSRPCS